MLAIHEDLTPDQAALAEGLARLLQRDGGHAARDFQAFGGPGLMVPERCGGVGLSSVEAALVARAVGRQCSPLPYIGQFVASRALVLAGGQDARLAAIARGECRIAVALRSGAAAVDGRLRGSADFVLDAPGCDALLVRDGHGALHLVQRQAGVADEPLVTVDRSRRIANVHLESAAAQRLEIDAPGLHALAALERLLFAAETLGACESLLQRTLAYARERRQFGRPIGSFQAIKHLCADLAAELDLARSLVWQAAARHAEDGDALLCAQAKAHMDDVARPLARGAVEVHGAMGFAAESGLHLWTKRIAVNRSLGGAPEQLRREIAALHGWVV